jgi:hypothetical protein
MGPRRVPRLRFQDRRYARLKVPDCSLGRWSEYAINNQTDVWSPAQCPLKAADGLTSRARTGSRLTRIEDCKDEVH